MSVGKHSGEKMSCITTFFRAFVVWCCLLTVGGCLEDLDSVTVAKKAWSNGIITNHIIEIKSKVDDLEVTKLVVNRGNCGRTDFQPKHLKFGQVITIYVDCDPIEAEVTTSAGPTSVSWSE